MKLVFFSPINELKPFITKIWLFENYSGFTNHGTLIVPNAKPKIIITINDSITTAGNGNAAICDEGGIYLIGAREFPVTLSTTGKVSLSIGIELNTEAAYKFLNVPMHEVANNTFSFTDIYEKDGRDLIELLFNEQNNYKKIDIIQNFLLSQLNKNKKSNNIFEHSVEYISSLNGIAAIKDIAKYLGYSKRYLDILYKNHIGITPKTYATIKRFRYQYKLWSQNLNAGINKIDYYAFYYDQSHFIKEFKRFTGFSPKSLAKFNNDFGKNF